MKKTWKVGVLCYYAGSIYGRTTLDCANYLAFDTNLTPVKTEYGHKHISWLGSKVRYNLQRSAALWCSFCSLCLTLKHIYFPILPSQPMHPPTHLTPDNWGPCATAYWFLGIELESWGHRDYNQRGSVSLEDRLQTKQYLFTFPHFSIHGMNHLSSAVLDFLTIQFMRNACISCV